MDINKLKVKHWRLEDYKQKGQDGEWVVKVSKRELAGRTPPQGLPTARVPQSSLKMFKIEPDHVKTVNADDGWEEIEFALDSGAAETVMGEDTISRREPRARGSWRTRLRPGNSIPTWGEEVSGRQSRVRDPEHHCPGMRREEGDAGWQPSGV